MHAYYAIIPPQVPIPPPTIVPPPPMLSPIFNPQEFFILEELLPPKEKMAPKRTSTSVAPAMTQAVIWNTGPRETPAARKCTYKEFMSCQPFYFNVKKIEDEFYNLVVKGNDLKTYSRRFQELATICPNMVLNNEKLTDVFIGRLPQSIEGTVTALKPQTLEEAINIAQRLLNQVLKHGSVQRTNDHKQKFDDRRNATNNVNNNPNNRDNNNYPNDRNNHYHQQ
nr:reverse transcriptase domain-containing protein [Tanacetum cinerariifolium]